ncbi:helix-turn-helix domain-containing protein [Aquimarina gracilis]|uniref:Helix-turn-helix domain-containing protein n=1 Tax=Aquimarina gracilis TaxID=874422 RepID=A0ABU5ZTG2_9FLAO|nr:helix-turn-helix domain-containing protein [Aquimarina gracilis]MEB3345081.1 helix-turn-helix domain-containing protein [Aquimarina gracilis]
MRIIPLPLDKISNILIRNMWIIEETNGININVKAFPTGYPYINVISGTSFTIKNINNNVLETSSYLSGNALTPFELNMSVIKRALTIQLQPYAIPYLTGIPANEFSELRVPIHCFSKYLSERLEELINSDLNSELVLQKVLTILNQYKNEALVDKRVYVALNNILSNRGHISINAINSKINLTQRRLQQLFKMYLGMSAKSYTRIVRMQSHTFKLLNGEKLDTIVPDGYFDQSHFIHDLKKQTSMSPLEFHKFITSSEHHAAYYVSNLFYGV